MDNVDVSVIVPAYNVARYLEQAVRSALQNDTARLEILVINDGSEDASLAIASCIAAEDSRVKVMSKPNGGYGSAVNMGIDAACGTYIAILEPDDWVDAHMYDELFAYATSYAQDADLPDIVKSAYWRVVGSDTHSERRWLCAYAGRVNPAHQPFALADAPRLVMHHPSIWSALYKRDFLDRNKIRFKEVPGAGWVDNPFLFETLLATNNIVYLDKAFYNYREDLEGSSSNKATAHLALERWHDMERIVRQHGVTDEGVLQALYTIGFRYLEGALAEHALSDPNVAELADEMGKHMDMSVVAGMPHISPQLKRFVAARAQAELPRANALAYYKNLGGEFIYSVRSNGLGFALNRLHLFKRRRAREANLSKDTIRKTQGGKRE